ncbi:MAG: PfkB family carbohydrate kinase, partial [Paracoccaceae bacterium]
MILCCGEALIDMLPRKTVAGEEAFSPYPGGALFNTAIALGRLGAHTGFLSGLSTDFFGDMLRSSLADSNVSSELSVLSDRPTTLAFVRLIEGQAIYKFYDENSAMRMLEPADIPAIPNSVQAMIFGCISLVGDPCGQFYEALMRQQAKSCVMM